MSKIPYRGVNTSIYLLLQKKYSFEHIRFKGLNLFNETFYRFFSNKGN
jgi:hypothetical protein